MCGRVVKEHDKNTCASNNNNVSNGQVSDAGVNFLMFSCIFYKKLPPYALTGFNLTIHSPVSSVAGETIPIEHASAPGRCSCT
jgi:hypothetical protein